MGIAHHLARSLALQPVPLQNHASTELIITYHLAKNTFAEGLKVNQAPAHPEDDDLVCLRPQ